MLIIDAYEHGNPSVVVKAEQRFSFQMVKFTAFKLIFAASLSNFDVDLRQL